MKTIEEAAEEYADKRVYNIIGVEHKDEFPMERRATKYDGYDMEQAFEDGAEYALANQWVSVADRLPEHGMYVMASDKYGSVCGARYNAQSEKWVGEYRNAITSFMDDITHWMPIPELKKNEE